MAKRRDNVIKPTKQWLQYWIDPDQYDELAQAALEENKMLGEMVRHCIATYLEIRKLERCP